MPQELEPEQILAEMEPRVGQLLNRHEKITDEWFPHELVPWGRGRDFDPDQAWTPQDYPLARGVRSALFVNLLTEENLPSYFAGLDRLGFRDGAWGAWARRWTAEEDRHAMVIRDYAFVTRVLDPWAFERARMRTMSVGFDMSHLTLLRGLVYTMLQELATRIAHRNTGRLLTDPCGDTIMSHVATDENLHHVFYRDLVDTLLEVYPSATLCALDKEVRNFSMPGTLIRNFRSHAFAIANVGIYNFRIHHDMILVPLLLKRWRIDKLAGLTQEAKTARERVLAHIDRVRQMAERQEERLGRASPDVADIAEGRTRTATAHPQL